MFKKIIYLGLGLADFLRESIDNWAEKGEAYLEKQAEVELEVIDVDLGAAEELVMDVAVETAVTPDDLTTITGIGPTFAERFNAAGITTFEQLAAMTPEEAKEISQAADWQADPEEWIAQAKAQTLVIA